MSEAKSVAVIVFGMDEERRSRAGTFSAENVSEAEKRAKEARLLSKPVANSGLAQLAATLQAGDLSKSGTSMVPLVGGGVYERVLAVTEVRPALPQAKAVATVRQPQARATRIVQTREQIDVGDLVLVADEEPGDGWFEAIVLEKTGEHVFRLKYRDYPDWPDLTKNRGELGLLPPTA